MHNMEFYTFPEVTSLLADEGVKRSVLLSALNDVESKLKKQGHLFKVKRYNCFDEDGFKVIRARALEIKEYRDKYTANAENTKGFYTAREICPDNPGRVTTWFIDRGPDRKLINPKTGRWNNYYGEAKRSEYLKAHGKMVTNDKGHILNKDAKIAKENHILKTMLEAKELQLQGRDKTIAHLQERIKDLESQVNHLTNELDGMVNPNHGGKLVKFRKAANE